MDQKLEALAKVPLLSGLSKKDLVEVGSLSDIVDVDAGYVLMREGAPGSEFFVILEGFVDIVAGGKFVQTMGPNDFLGEIALVDHSHRTATATTTSKAKLVVLGTGEFKSLMTLHPDIQLAVMNALARRLRSRVPIRSPDPNHPSLGRPVSGCSRPCRRGRSGRSPGRSWSRPPWA